MVWVCTLYSFQTELLITASLVLTPPSWVVQIAQISCLHCIKQKCFLWLYKQLAKCLHYSFVPQQKQFKRILRQNEDQTVPCYEMLWSRLLTVHNRGLAGNSCIWHQSLLCLQCMKWKHPPIPMQILTLLDFPISHFLIFAYAITGDTPSWRKKNKKH